ncbi:MAG TPA: META domain-containing protein [Allosphingosinicella sp.]|nr:META domain-containing protein [Allosphingosinicella sp.]
MKLLPILLLALSACTTLVAAEQPYAGLGTEPFWSIEIAGGRMTYETPGGGFSVPAPEPVATPNGRRFETPRLTLDVTPRVCSDGMSDNLYADNVTAVADGVTLHGCGGPVVAPDTLAHSSWSIDDINGEPVFEQDYVMEFGTDRVSGRAGCNRFSGPYGRSGDTLTFGPLAATRMACPEPRMEHERQVLEVLGAAVRLQAGENDTLLLIGAGGGRLQLRRTFDATDVVTQAN